MRLVLKRIHRAAVGASVVTDARARIIGATAVTMALVAGVAAVPSVVAAIATGQLWIIAFDALLFGWIVGLAVWRRRAPRGVGVQIVLVLYLTGVGFTLPFGISSAGPLFLFAAPIFAAAALGRRPALVLLGINVIVLALLGGALNAGVLAWGTVTPPVIFWMIAGSFIFLNTILTVSVAVLLDRLDASLAQNVALSAALEQATDLVVLSDAALRVHWSNAVSLEMGALGPGGLADRQLGSLFDLLPAQAHALSALENTPAPWRGSLRGRDGRVFDATITALVDPKGSPSGFVLVARDVTHDALLRGQLDRAQRLEAMGTLAGGIAHDLNNMLAPVLTNTEALLETEVSPSEQRVLLDEIAASTKRARRLIGRILRVSAPTRDGGASDLAELVREEMRLLRATVPPHVKVELSGAHDPMWVRLGEAEIQRVLLNLCLNAAHAMERDGGTITVRLARVSEDAMVAAGTLKAGPGVCLEVVDDGPGMDEATAERVFDPFFTTKPGAAGTGLGLTGVHQIVSQNGGAIALSTRLGEGATFAVYLPSSDPRDAPAETVRSQNKWPGYRALLIDDDDGVRAALSRALRRLGIETTAEAGGAAALERLRADPSRFDVVITDLTMPEVSGLEVAREVRAVRPDLPVVVVTGRVEDDLDVRAEELGVSAWLLKPVTLAELRDVLATVLPTDALIVHEGIGLSRLGAEAKAKLALDQPLPGGTR